MTSFKDYIGQLMKEAIKQEDIDLAKAINELFYQMEINFLDCDELVSGFMTEFTADLVQSIEQKVDKETVLGLIDELMSHPEKTEPYYALSYYIKRPELEKLRRENYKRWHKEKQKWS